MRMKFTDIVEFSGKTCSTFDGKKNYISTGCVHDDHICKDEIETVEYINKPSRANLVVEPGDILFAKMQATKKTLLINEDLSQNIYSTGFYAVKPKDGLITKKCLFYLINSSLFLGEKDKNCSGATQKAINNQVLSSIELNIPEFSVQKLLTQKLDVLSKVIEVKQSQIRFFDNLIKARFVEMFEANMDTVPLRDICKTASGGTPSTKYPDYYKGTIPWISTTALGSNHISGDSAKAYITKEAIDNSATRLIPKENLLFGIRVGVGKTSINDVDICINQDIVAITNIDEARFSKLFIKHVLDANQAYYDSLKKGATILGITSDDLKNTPIPLVSFSRQKSFESFVEQVDKSKFALVKSINLLKKSPFDMLLGLL